MPNVQIKRAYEPAKPSDGYRVLVDRLWPRGVSKQRAALDDWMKTVAPSTQLRQWFGHDPARWKEFAARYRAELKTHAPELADLEAHARKGTLTLVFGARDVDHNEAAVLRDVLLKKQAR